MTTGRRIGPWLGAGGGLMAFALCSSALSEAQSVAPPRFSFEAVDALARSAAGDGYRAPAKIPPTVKALSYDQFRDIRFKSDHALWRNGPLFTIQLFHLGFLYERPVQISMINGGVSTPVAFRSDLFDYGKNTFKKPLPADLGFAGFRVHYPLHVPDYFDEVAAFLGASYFRVLGREQQYGLSARGLAIDTASPRGEEFPAFREFWLEQPQNTASDVTFYALLDSPGITGAYRFLMRPGTDTTVDVTLTLYPRHDIEKVGIAPLTSMMLYGENRTRGFDDFRPEVHDSDGLLVETQAGERVWRPLMNPRELRISSFIGENPRGFGLLQRDRTLAHYADLEANYQKRPSYWVEPLGNWGAGHIELIEIPSSKEIDDNIVAYWVSDKPARKGEPIQLSYRLHALLDDRRLAPLGRVEATRIGTAAHAGAKANVPKDARLFVVDFNSEDLALLRAAQPIEAVISASSGKIIETLIQKNPETGGWRVSIQFLPQEEKSADLRCFLRLRGEVLTETWTYLWSP